MEHSADGSCPCSAVGVALTLEKRLHRWRSAGAAGSAVQAASRIDHDFASSYTSDRPEASAALKKTGQLAGPACRTDARVTPHAAPPRRRTAAQVRALKAQLAVVAIALDQHVRQ